MIKLLSNADIERARKMKKTAIITALAVLLSLLCAISVSAAKNGVCGDSAVWSFDTQSGTLYITGTGDMFDYEKETSVQWYSIRSEIKAVSVSQGITHIGKNAFRRLTEMTSLSLPDGLLSIGESAFAFCDSFSSVALPKSLTTIDKEAFYCAAGLKSVTLPEGLTALGEEAFFGCLQLSSVTVPKNIKVIGKNTFNSCMKLESVGLPSSLTTVKDGAFANCFCLKEVYFTGDIRRVNIGESNGFLTGAKIIGTVYTVGDTDGNGSVTADDAIYLLYHVFFPQKYPVVQPCDFDKSGGISADDAIYLLYHIFFPSKYPL